MAMTDKANASITIRNFTKKSARTVGHMEDFSKAETSKKYSKKQIHFLLKNRQRLARQSQELPKGILERKCQKSRTYGRTFPMQKLHKSI